ncbi:hypothetical protein HPB51_008462 [Rhipicephalus microplus]|uniref:Uncharacterized protein n=1 Tax=Rhipicephalus microplus TaxID=6941 RepID=A0A9J6ERN8_RHIMP|nr:hypothetical protein HPB51_008462 [Rhipicephalus microplus]
MIDECLKPRPEEEEAVFLGRERACPRALPRRGLASFVGRISRCLARATCPCFRSNSYTYAVRTWLPAPAKIPKHRPGYHTTQDMSTLAAARARANLPELSDLFKYWPGYQRLRVNKPSKYHRSEKRRKSKSPSSSGPRSRAACLRPSRVPNLYSAVTTSSETLPLDGPHVGNEEEEVAVEVVVDVLRFTRDTRRRRPVRHQTFQDSSSFSRRGYKNSIKMRVSTKPPDTRNNQPPLPGHPVVMSFPTSPGRLPKYICAVQPLPSSDPSKLGATRKSSSGASKVFLRYEEVVSGQKPEP